MYCKDLDSKGNACGNESTSGTYHASLATIGKRQNETLQQDATMIRQKVDTEERSTTTRNSRVDSVTVEVYTRLFGTN